MYCTYCRYPGHVRNKCYKLNPEITRNKSINNGTSSVQFVSVSNNDSIKSENNNDAKTHLESLYNPNYGKYFWVGQITGNDGAVHNLALLGDSVAQQSLLSKEKVTLTIRIQVSLD